MAEDQPTVPSREPPTRFRVSGALPPAIHTPIYMTHEGNHDDYQTE